MNRPQYSPSGPNSIEKELIFIREMGKYVAYLEARVKELEQKLKDNIQDDKKPKVSDTLFDIPPVYPDKFCRTCEHRERHHCGSMVIQYCGIRKSNLTDNGKLKIKCKTPACQHYEPEKNK